MTSRPPRVLGIEMERLWNAPVAGASYSPLDSARQRSQSRERQPEMSNGDMQGLLEHDQHDQHDQDIDVDEEAAVLRLGGQSSENLGWARPPINPFRRGFWEKLPNVWFFPDTLKQAAYATGVCMVLLAVVFGATVGLTVLANHRHRGPAAPSYQYDGAATQSDTCDASFPRTYCGAVGINKGDCEAQGCCWGPDKAFNKDVPSCYQPNTAAKMGQYKVKSKLKTELGWSLHLELNNPNPILPTLGPDMKRLQVTVDAYTRERLHIKIEPAPSDEDQAEPRWEVPVDMVPRPLKPSGAPEDPLYVVSLPEPEEDFWIEVHRVSGPGAANDTKPVFSTRGWGLVFKDQYMQLTTHLDPSSTLIGTGESTLSTGLILPRNGKIITMWNTDTAAWNQDVSLYGSHPFYLELRQLGGTGADRQAAAHGVFLLNSNGMDIELWREHLTYRVIGGVFDFSILMGPEPEAVTQQYHEIIGLPVLPARWALGYHQCRWGYKTVQDMMDVVVKHLEAKLPLDVMWSDIDYMLDYRVWTLDPIRYTPEVMNNFVQWLHAQGLHWVPIQDPAVQLNPSWPVWNQGVEQGVFVRDTGGKEPYLGQVWAGPSAWPDFFNEKTKQYWSTNIAAFRQMVPADGLWLDMNEASNFCSGACTLPSKLVMFWRMFTLGNNECLLDCEQPDHSDKLNDPPYRINVMGQRAVLYAKTIVTSGKHANGYVQYDTHNMYALSEAKTTYEALAAQTQQRPFILSRASFPGLGRYSAHWTGDNWASWEDLRRSVTGMLNSNLWGIPLVGSDICGFSGESNEHLCARWMEVGAFTPFSRNHADIASPSHEAYLWPKTRLAAGAALRLRYRLLPVLYTQFHNVAQKGGTVARAIFWEWPGDEDAIKEADKAWMLGNALMIAPVLWEDRMDGRNVYFPKGTWYRLSEGSTEQRAGPAHVEIKAPIGEPSVWARAGYILPTVAEETFTTIKAFAAPLRMLVLLPAGSCNSSTTTGGDGGDGEPLAFGELYADDGLSLPTDPLFVAVNLTFTAGCGVVNGQVRGWLNFNAVTPAAGAGEAGRKLQQNTGDKKWDPSQVLVSQVHVAGMPAPIPGATWTAPTLTVDTTRGVDAGALLTEEVCSARTVQVTFDQERVQLTLERPIPLICLTRVEWDVPVA